jgi:hypothetical protein
MAPPSAHLAVTPRRRRGVRIIVQAVAKGMSRSFAYLFVCETLAVVLGTMTLLLIETSR